MGNSATALLILSNMLNVHLGVYCINSVQKPCFQRESKLLMSIRRTYGGFVKLLEHERKQQQIKNPKGRTYKWA